MRPNINKFISCIILCLLPITALSATWSLTYPRPIEEGDLRDEYPLALLTLALEKTGVKYSLLPSERILLQGKALRQLKENREINVMWSMTDTQREKDLLPIRIPIGKGLIGWRVFLISKTAQARFNDVATVQDLISLDPVQGEDWPDTKILQANGFNVVTVKDHKRAFTAVTTNRADFFPRSVIEVLQELKTPAIAKELAVEEKLAIHYPTAFYFFVNKGNTTLARLIETGLQLAIEDGSFDALFLSSYEETLRQLDLDSRRVFHLDNPLLPELTPIDDKKLWYYPETSKGAEVN
ncbi:transporter substrate-binding domain-containing protein [Alteromonas ponticola]|uniref:Transporter substrate-binding domain-containing protein n=1 Tax=Alteromonas aquimaris TaxID=2998417 RepID=A0ABT3P4U6_9ALTE|nr:transporter substrate-binding domain-containing protein [Alteromonas aquimaris]MCW8107762.1 transporter substrate-binding domain-containing protein [Alteromonas aquimaris]